MNPFEFARTAFDTTHWNSDDFGDNVAQLLAGAVGLIILLSIYMSLVADVPPMLGGGGWYVVTAVSPAALFIALELLVPIFSSRPPWKLFVLGLLIGPGFLVIWVPWFTLWLVWRAVRVSWILRTRAAWRSYWTRRRSDRRVPRAIVETQ